MARISYIDKLNAFIDSKLIDRQQAVDMLIKHNKKLEKNRKYEKGELITSIDELLSCEFVYIYEKLWHKKWFLNLQLGLLIHWITHNKIRKAIKKEKKNG